MELFPSAQSPSQKENFVNTTKTQALNFSRIALFHIKTRVFLKHPFVLVG